MFSQAAAQSQVAVGLTRLGHIFNMASARQGSSMVASRTRFKLRVPSKQARPEISATAEPFQHSLETDTCISDEAGMGESVGVVRKEELVDLLDTATQTTRSPHHPATSTHRYVSAHTFFENKSGFEEGLLQTLSYQQPFWPVLVGNKAKLLVPPIQPVLQQYRGLRLNGRIPWKQSGFPAADKKTVSRVKDSQSAGETMKIHFHVAKEVPPTIWQRFRPYFLKLVVVTLTLYSLYHYLRVRFYFNEMIHGLGFGEDKQAKNHGVIPEMVDVTFDDVKGIEETTEELQDLVHYLSNPDKFKRLGAKVPRGVLLEGNPGVGKTLVAKAVAGEAKVPFFQTSGSEFEEIFVGVGAKRVRDLFKAAKAAAPCIVFIDEIDTVGSSRQNHRYSWESQTINQLLAEMDGFSSKDGVIVIGATNNKENLDKALLRPGRFDVEINVLPPDLAGRKEIFKLYLSKIALLEEIDVERVAKLTRGQTGANINNVVNQAALRAVKENREGVIMEDILYALDKCSMGAIRSTRERRFFDKKAVAVYTAGTTIAALYTKGAATVNKVTVAPRTKSLGHTNFLSNNDFLHSKTRDELFAQIDISNAGRVAQEVFLGPDKITEGCEASLKRASKLATRLVRNIAMSDKGGYRAYLDPSKQMSGKQMAMLDTEINKILKESYARVKALLEEHREEHERLTEALMKYETIDMHEIRDVLNGKPIRPADEPCKKTTKRCQVGLEETTV